MGFCQVCRLASLTFVILVLNQVLAAETEVAPVEAADMAVEADSLVAVPR